VKPSVEDQTSIEVRKSLGSFESVRQYVLDNGRLSSRLIGVDFTSQSASVNPSVPGQTSSSGSSDLLRPPSAPAPVSGSFIKPTTNTLNALHRNTHSSSNSATHPSSTSGAPHHHNNIRPTTATNSTPAQKVHLSQSQTHPSSSVPLLSNHLTQTICSSTWGLCSSSGVVGGSALSATVHPLVQNPSRKPSTAAFTAAHPTYHLSNNAPSSLISGASDPLLSSTSIQIPKIVRNNNNNIANNAIITENSPITSANYHQPQPLLPPSRTNNLLTVPPSTSHYPQNTSTHNTIQSGAPIEDLPNPLSGASTERRPDNPATSSKKPAPVLERVRSHCYLNYHSIDQLIYDQISSGNGWVEALLVRKPHTRSMAHVSVYHHIMCPMSCAIEYTWIWINLDITRWLHLQTNLWHGSTFIIY